MSVQEVYNYSNTQQVIVAMAPSSLQLTRHSETNFKPKPVHVLLHGHSQHTIHAPVCGCVHVYVCVRACVYIIMYIVCVVT